jgi:hypothetical protein
LAILILSVALNVFLGGAAIRFFQRPAFMAPETHAAPYIHPLPKSAPRDPITVEGMTTNHFNWEKLKADDYEQYAANLRAIGCPEKTVRDIIIPELEKLYALKIATLSSGDEFWTAGRKREAAYRAREARTQLLEQEKSDLLKRLGIDETTKYEGQNEDLEGQAIFRFIMGPLKPGVLEQVMAVFENSEVASRQLQKETQGILLPEDEARVAKLRDQLLADLNRLLTPQQFQEFILRFTALSLNNSFEGLSLTGADFRKIAQLRVEVYGPLDGKPFDNSSSDDEAADKAKEKEFEARLKASFGAAWYEEYERAQDGDYKQLNSFIDQQHLPREVALKVYELKQLADSEQQRLREDASLQPAERDARLGAVQDSTGAAVRQLMGDTVFENYLRQGNGRWMTNLSQP